MTIMATRIITSSERFSNMPNSRVIQITGDAGSATPKANITAIQIHLKTTAILSLAIYAGERDG